MVEHEGSAPDSGGAALALTRYLSDEIPPMIFAGTAELLVDAPRVAAEAIQAWLTAQYQGKTPLAVLDYLFHAAKKIHLLAELELMPADQVRSILHGVLPFLLELCPDADRERLLHSLHNLGDTQAVLAATAVEIIHRPADAQAGAERAAGEASPARAAAPASAMPLPALTPPTPADAALASQAAQVVKGLSRLNLLLDRLESMPVTVAAGAAPGDAPNAALVAEIVGEVAAGAHSDRELDGQLRFLEQLGLPLPSESVLRLLSQSLPDWARPSVPGVAPDSGPLQAMRRVVNLARDRGETMKRFSELVNVAVEELNTGSLGRAVTMLDLAERMIADKEVDSGIAANVVGQAYLLLDAAQLRKLAESEDKHALLRRVLGFFPQLRVEELLLELEAEKKRDRRRLLISLLTVHGGTAREAALVSLRDTMTGARASSWFVERNLILLLRKIPRPADADIDPEIDVLVHGSELAGPLPLLREAVAVLSQIRHERAERTLVARVAELEDALVGGSELPHEPGELRGLLDSIVKVLARVPSDEARRCVVAHGLRRQAQLGDTLGRLAALGAGSLADDPASVQKLVAALRSELPVKIFGVLVAPGRKAQGIEWLIEAVAGTDAPPVRQVLSEIVEHFPGQDFAQRAAAALEKLGAVPTAAREEDAASPSLSGDLGVFGLPGLLQNLADSRLTGALVLHDPAGNHAATLWLQGGLLRTAVAGPLTDVTAVYQLLERPTPGRFVFTQEERPAPPTEGPEPREVVLVLLEGMRRYDELARATALVPDAARYQATERRPSPPPDESDASLLHQVWTEAACGTPAADCEATVATDSYRVRRLLEHWITEGALVARRGDE